LLLSVGIDDTDSPEGGCTTYLAASLICTLRELGASFMDYPLLVRLNPNAPWKTRGNGAVCLRLSVPDENLEAVKRIIINTIEAQGNFQCDNTNPGVIFHEGIVPLELKSFYESVLTTIVKLEKAEELINRHCSGAIGWKNRRGLIGALASIGATLTGDHTYELLTYRKAENLGKKRLIDFNSVKSMDKQLGDTFNTVDPDNGQILITPRGPDPVLYGVRGETAESVFTAYGMIKTLEPVEMWAIFRTNQGTDAHLTRNYKISELEPFYPSIVVGEVTGNIIMIEGGHVIFTLKDETGEVDCAAYEPSGGFRFVVQGLRVGDFVKVAGGVRKVETGLTINLERIEILTLVRDTRLVNPRCPECGGSTESMGREQGFRCKVCGHRDIGFTKVEEEIKRSLRPGVYLPPLRAERHLTKPLKRYGRERSYIPAPLHQPWYG
jgi:tRNA(Ile2)-agmatinylcytidine synthase